MATLQNTTISDTGFLKIAVGTDAQRPAGAAAQFRYNTTSNKLETYTAGTNIWQPSEAKGVRATGGTVYDTNVDGTTYRVHVFTATGNTTFTVSRGGTVEYLLVAGGGGGSGNFYDDGGGGGGGGLVTGSTSVTAQAYTITVGAGGVKSEGYTPGGNTTALGLTALGGGGGGGHRSSGQAGGSGGGAAGWYGPNDGQTYNPGAANQPGSASGGFGFPGGGYSPNEATGAVYPSSSGGGGAGSKGRRPSEAGGSSSGGGSGRVVNITGLDTFYAGGGGGISAGPGGIGGGATASTGRGGSPARDATPNTGGGGGAGRRSEDPGAPSDGGSGIVVIRYPVIAEPDVAVNTISDNGLVLDLDFAKSTTYVGSGTTVSDSSARLTGTITGSSTSFIDVRTHRSAFRGSITAGNDISMDPRCIPVGNEITILFWNFGRTQQSSSIIAASHNSSSQTLNIHLPWVDGNVYWDCGEPFNRQAFGVSTIYTGWRHWVFTHNANTGYKRIYNAGVEVNAVSGQTSSIPAMTVCRIGGYWSGSNYGHDGDIGMCRIYNREITAAEVLAHYSATRWRFGV